MECASDWQSVIDALALILGVIGYAGVVAVFWLTLRMLG